MIIGMFTDTYFPQISGVASSIKTLKEELERNGHEVIIFTTTDPKAPLYEEGIVRLTSIPFHSFKERRIAVKGMYRAAKLAKSMELDIVHTHTEFSLGWTGQFVANSLGIPWVHTYHTMYEDYLHYVAKGMLFRPSHVKLISKYYCNQTNGIIAPSEKTELQLRRYGVTTHIETISTGVNIASFAVESTRNIREELGISRTTPLLLSLSRLAKEKNIEAVIQSMPKIKEYVPDAKLLIAGDGPNRSQLEKLSQDLGTSEAVLFIGEVESSQVQAYYQAADLFVSASDSESQGLTYIEAMAAGTDIVVKKNEYTEKLVGKGKFGAVFAEEKDFTEVIVNRLRHVHPQPISAQERKEMLDSISSAGFCEKIINFYYRTLVKHYEKTKVYKVQSKTR